MGVDYRCNQQTNCSILASTNVFGDPCPGTLKYLEAHYQCVPGKRHFLGSLGGRGGHDGHPVPVADAPEPLQSQLGWQLVSAVLMNRPV